MKYRGVVHNQVTNNFRFTRWYGTYEEAYDAAERLGKHKEIWINCDIDVESEEV